MSLQLENIWFVSPLPAITAFLGKLLNNAWTPQKTYLHCSCSSAMLMQGPRIPLHSNCHVLEHSVPSLSLGPSPPRLTSVLPSLGYVNWIGFCSESPPWDFQWPSCGEQDSGCVHGTSQFLMMTWETSVHQAKCWVTEFLQSQHPGLHVKQRGALSQQNKRWLDE